MKGQAHIPWKDLFPGKERFYEEGASKKSCDQDQTRAGTGGHRGFF